MLWQGVIHDSFGGRQQNADYNLFWIGCVRFSSVLFLICESENERTTIKSKTQVPLSAERKRAQAQNGINVQVIRSYSWAGTESPKLAV